MDENRTIAVPGRVNLIGEHIDYHNLAVLPMAIDKHIVLRWRRSAGLRIRAASASQPSLCDFEWTRELRPGPPGDWGNYVKAAAQAVRDAWPVRVGIDGVVSSDLPAAAGLSSSSALLTAFTLALLEANEIPATFAELMRVLPEGEHFVGTRGGAMDHAAVLAARKGCALLVNFAPVSAEPITIPTRWRFLVAHSLVMARKSDGARLAYNRIRALGSRALQQPETVLGAEEAQVARHIRGEVRRVTEGVHALRNDDLAGFGQILFESHVSLRDELRVSCAELDRIIEIAREAGAAGARLTGAGFGGCAIIVADADGLARARAALESEFYADVAGFDPSQHLFEAVASDGALTSTSGEPAR